MSTGMPRPSSVTVIDFFGESGEGLVYGVVDDLVNEMVQSHLTGGADVHGGAQTYGLQPFENLDVLAGVVAVVAVVVGQGELVCC
jgi:hypothetical protein